MVEGEEHWSRAAAYALAGHTVLLVERDTHTRDTAMDRIGAYMMGARPQLTIERNPMHRAVRVKDAKFGTHEVSIMTERSANERVRGRRFTAAIFRKALDEKLGPVIHPTFPRPITQDPFLVRGEIYVAKTCLPPDPRAREHAAFRARMRRLRVVWPKGARAIAGLPPMKINAV